MGVFEHFPYVNYHELNLSWILRKLKELEDVIGTQIVDLVARAGVAENAQAISDLTETVETNATTAHNEAAAAQSTANSAANAASAAQTSANTANAGVTAINTALTPTSESDAFQIANANITNLERSGIRKYGKVCVGDLTFTVGTTITENTAVLFTGLPPGIGNQRFRVSHSYATNIVDLDLAITTEGTIINQWSTGGVPAGTYQGEFVYIMR